MKQGYFYGLNFLLGFVSLAVEILIARALAPYWGAGTLVWSFVVGFVLLVLAFGYWYGGKWADRYPDEKHLLFYLAPSALFLLPLAFLPPDSGITLLLFTTLAAISLFLMGAGAPWVLRILTRDVEHTGELAGRLFAAATIGSFLGSLLTALLLLPYLGTRASFLSLAFLLLFYLALRLPLMFVAVLLLPLFFYTPLTSDAIWEKNSRDQLVRVFQEDDVRKLVINNPGNTQSFYKKGQYLSGSYWDGPLFLWRAVGEKGPKKVLILGNGAGTSARSLRHFYPEMLIDTVEVDPVVSEAAKKFFDFREDQRLRLYQEDARNFVQGREKRYDLIFLDVYDSSFIPFQFATREFYQELRDDLNKGGLLLINVNSKNKTVLQRLSSTGRSVFPYLALYRLNNNILLLLSESKMKKSFYDPIGKQRIDLGKAPLGSKIWTDDKSDIELLFPF